MSSEPSKPDDQSPPAAAPQPPPSGEEPTDALVVQRVLSNIFAAQIAPAESAMEKAVASNLSQKSVEKLVEVLRDREKNTHDEAMERIRNRPWIVFATVVAVLLFVLVFGWLALAYQKPEVIKEVVLILVGLVGAAFGGYGLRGRTESKPPS